MGLFTGLNGNEGSRLRCFKWFQPFRKYCLSKWAYRPIRFTLGAVFIWSGVSKLANPQSFSVIIGAYGLINDSWVLPVSLFLPLIELFGGVGLLLDLRGSLTTIAGLLLLFMLILGYGIWMGLDVDCGCLGRKTPRPGHTTVFVPRCIATSSWGRQFCTSIHGGLSGQRGPWLGPI